jgi:hypothetical protein
VVTDETGSPGSLVFSGNPTLTGATIDGNLAFSGNARRITGDFSNATSANRTLFQTSTPNKQTAIGVIPNGSATQGTLIAYNKADPDNAAYVVFLCNATESSFRTSYAGTAGFLPMTFHIGGAEKARVATDGTFTAGGVNTAPALKVTPVASQARWIEVTGATSSTHPKIAASAGSLELGSTATVTLTLDSSQNADLEGVLIGGQTSVAISSALTNLTRSVLVTATGTTQTLPAASAAIIGGTWTVSLGALGYVDITVTGADTFNLPTSDTTIRLTSKGDSVSIRCTSATQWSIV